MFYFAVLRSRNNPKRLQIHNVTTRYRKWLYTNEHALWLFQLIPCINPAMSAVMISIKKVVVQNFQSPQLEMSPLPKDYEISGIPQLRSCRHTHIHKHRHMYYIYIYTYHTYIHISSKICKQLIWNFKFILLTLQQSWAQGIRVIHWNLQPMVSST